MSEMNSSLVAAAEARQGRIHFSSSMIMLAAFSAIIAVGVLVLPEVMVGITEASITRRPGEP